MDHAFTLSPNLSILKKHGYDFITPFEVESIWTKEERLRVEDGFKRLFDKYGLSEHYDTLLYIILVRHNDADMKFQYRRYMYHQHKRVNELAQLLSMYEPGRKHRPNLIKVSTKLDSIKVTDSKLIEWIGTQIIEAIEGGEFAFKELGEAIPNFTSNDKGDIINDKQYLDYKKIASYATQTIRKPSVRDRNKVLSKFLLSVHDYLESESLLVKSTNVRYSAAELRLLFDFADLLGWFKDQKISSNIEDYMHALLSNNLNTNH